MLLLWRLVQLVYCEAYSRTYAKPSTDSETLNPKHLSRGLLITRQIYVKSLLPLFGGYISNLTQLINGLVAHKTPSPAPQPPPPSHTQ
jgi:hypothetical protein